jgi:hypothetical protein
MSESTPLEPESKTRLIEIDWNPPDRQLRQFGLIAFFALPLLGWLFLGRPWGGSWDARATTVLGVLFAVGSIAAVAAIIRPQALRLPFVVACLAAFPIGMVVGELMLAVIYFLVFTPVAVLFRTVGRDALGLRIDKSHDSYWQPKRRPKGPASYFRQS